MLQRGELAQTASARGVGGEGGSPTSLADLSANLTAGTNGGVHVGIGKTVAETDRDQQLRKVSGVDALQRGAVGDTTGSQGARHRSRRHRTRRRT